MPRRAGLDKWFCFLLYRGRALVLVCDQTFRQGTGLKMTKIAKQPTPVNCRQTVGEAFAAILKHHLHYLLQWENAARSWQDTEGVHQMRVTFRRMRSALRIFRPAVPKPVTARWSEQMRWFANQFGPARDLDVFIDESLGAVAGKLPLPGELKLSELAQHYRTSAYETVKAALDSQHYSDFKRDLDAWLDSRIWLSSELTAEQRKRLDSNLIPFSRQRLDKQERRVLAAGSHVDQDSPQAMHQLRIECKKLRYAAEFFSPLFNGMEDFINPMKGLQDLLGIMNDVNVMHRLLEQLLAEERDPEIFQYSGGLVGWRTRQYYEIKDTFDTRWEQFINAKHPWWRKSALNY